MSNRGINKVISVDGKLPLVLYVTSHQHSVHVFLCMECTSRECLVPQVTPSFLSTQGQYFDFPRTKPDLHNQCINITDVTDDF